MGFQGSLASVNFLNNNKLIWILSGQLYNSPKNAFINFYPDYKLNHSSYIFRTKIVNHYAGYTEFRNNKQSLYQRLIRIINNKYSLSNSKIRKLKTSIKNANYILEVQNLRYLLTIKVQNAKFYFQLTRNQQFATRITNTFRTLTGGTLYYNYQNILKSNQINKFISYFNRTNFSSKSKFLISHKTIIWLGEEIHLVNCESNILLVENGDFISEGFELIPGLFSKTSGIVLIRQKSNLVHTISIKSGLVYEGKKFKNVAKTLYYPGEVILSNILVKQLSFCEHIVGKNIEQLLVRPLEIYEFPHSNLNQDNIQNKWNQHSNINLRLKIIYSYKSNQIIKGTKNLNLVSNILNFESTKPLTDIISIEAFNNKKTKSIDIQISEKLNLNNYLLPNLRYKNIESCFLLQ